MLDHCQWMYMQTSHRCATNRAGIYPCGWMIFGTGEIPPKLDNPGTLGHHFNINGSHHTCWGFMILRSPMFIVQSIYLCHFMPLKQRLGWLANVTRKIRFGPWPKDGGPWLQVENWAAPHACLHAHTHMQIQSSSLHLYIQRIVDPNSYAHLSLSQHHYEEHWTTVYEFRQIKQTQ